MGDYFFIIYNDKALFAIFNMQINFMLKLKYECVLPFSHVVPIYNKLNMTNKYIIYIKCSL